MKRSWDFSHEARNLLRYIQCTRLKDWLWMWLIKKFNLWNRAEKTTLMTPGRRKNHQSSTRFGGMGVGLGLGADKTWEFTIKWSWDFPMKRYTQCTRQEDWLSRNPCLLYTQTNPDKYSLNHLQCTVWWGWIPISPFWTFIKVSSVFTEELLWHKVFGSFTYYNFPRSIQSLLGRFGTGSYPCSPSAIYFNHHDLFILASTQSCHKWREGSGTAGSHTPGTNTM